MLPLRVLRRFNVDPLTGFARSVGPGVVKLVAQAGDATDTVSITVQPSAGMAMPTAADRARQFSRGHLATGGWLSTSTYLRQVCNGKRH